MAIRCWIITEFCTRIRALHQGTQSELVIAKTALCSELCSVSQDPVNVFVSEGNLIIDESDNIEPARLWLTKSTTLQTILQTHKKISIKHKAVLMLLLARAVWQFYDTGWLRIPWTTAGIHFITERRHNEVGDFIDEPFIITQFEQEVQRSNKIVRRSNFDTLKALGTVLLEIELGILMQEEERNLEEYQTLQAKSEAERAVYTAKTIFNQSDRMENVPDRLKHVIGHCLKPDKFRRYESEPAALRAAIKDNVLNPVLNTFKALWNDLESTDLRKPTVPLSPSVPSEGTNW